MSTGIASGSNQTVQSGSNQVDTTQSGVQDQSSTTQNLYSPGAEELQGGANSLLQNLLTGGSGAMPSGMGITDAAYESAFRHFNQGAAHQLANQGGAGSPTLMYAQQQLAQDLAVQDSQMQWDNLFGVFDEIAKIAYEPTGSTTTGQSSVSQQGSEAGSYENMQEGSYDSNSIDIGSILTGLFTGLGSGFSSI